jgi:hypothetical protein
MDQEELEIWRQIDVGYYGSTRAVFDIRLCTIEKDVLQNKQDVKKNLEPIKSRYEKIVERLQGMNLESLDDRFPVDVLKELRDDIFPDMGRRYEELEFILNQYITTPAMQKSIVIDKIVECLNVVNRMGALGLKVSQNEGYIEYRRTNPDRIYLKTDNN